MSNSQNERVTQGLQALQKFSRDNRTSLVVAAVTMLSGFALTAVAVSPLVAASANVPQRVVSEAVQPQGIAAQLKALAAQDISLIRSDVTRGTDTPEKLLARMGVRDASAVAFIRRDAVARLLVTGRGGKMVKAVADGDGALLELTARYPTDKAGQAENAPPTHFTRMTLKRTAGAGGVAGDWQVSTQAVPYGTQQRMSSGTIRSSLFAATDEAGLPDVVAAQMAEIFSTDIDFHRQLRKGDTFSLVYEALTADNEPVVWNEGAGRVQAAEFISNGKIHSAVWFTGADGRGGYYTAEGRSKRQFFLASPLEFSRVTSGFAMRFHPLLKSWRQHNGVDYGAPTGTPVRAVGDGTVEFAGRQNGYGNVVQIKHSQDRSTLYAHLSAVDVKQGQRIEQGQRLGAVGSTGWATGPHLHFEFQVAGQHHDPLTIASASDTPMLDVTSRQRFAALVQVVQAKLEVAETLAGRHNAAE
jgi:murein DD-endopeptidase MepM/ murein hydrolase activator NlpD